jgi:hypothetical protein
MLGARIAGEAESASGGIARGAGSYPETRRRSPHCGRGGNGVPGHRPRCGLLPRDPP